MNWVNETEICVGQGQDLSLTPGATREYLPGVWDFTPSIVHYVVDVGISAYQPAV
jgi:hypothetical protein